MAARRGITLYHSPASRAFTACRREADHRAADATWRAHLFPPGG